MIRAETKTVPKGFVPTTCCRCGYEFFLKPPLMFELFGENTGHVGCPQCRLFCHVELVLDGQTPTSAVLEDHTAWLERTNI